MAKNRFSCHPKQQIPAMSPSHTYTVGAVVNSFSPDDDDEDNDICPVCDRECTCDNRPRSTLSSSTTSVQNTGSHRASKILPHPAPVQQTLKIRLTVPPSMLNKRRAFDPTGKKLKDNAETISAPGKDVEMSTSQAFNPHGLPDMVGTTKRRGRPPKSSTTKVIIEPRLKGVTTTAFSAPSTSFSQAQSKRKNTLHSSLGQSQIKSNATRPLVQRKGKGTTVNKTALPRRPHLCESSGSELTDLEDAVSADDDTQFPTFVSASAISSSEASDSDSDSDSSSMFDTESSIEAEEENYIITEERLAHDKARIRRELLGDEGVSKRRDSRDSWVIRPRQKSVDPNDVEMDGTSDDGTDDEDEDDDEDEEGEDEEEPDGRAPGVNYVGVATGWSEDEESSFDADLFFANLSDSTTEPDTSQAGESNDNVNHSDLDSEAAVADFSPHDLARRQMDNMLFEVTEGWDGQIVFTNRLREGQGILDIDFEVNAAQLVVETNHSPSESLGADVQMTDGEDTGYEEDQDCDLEQSSGDTTEEELVGDNGLPTERAMKLFRLPCSVSAINPMSTVSPTASPSFRVHRRVRSYQDTPRPADILAGKIFWEQSDDHPEGGGSIHGTRSVTSPKSGLPLMGQFDPVESNPQKRAIIDLSSKDVPSPFQHHGRGRRRSRIGSFSKMDRICGRPSSLPGSNRSSFQIMSSEELVIATSPQLPPAEPIDLDDVLDVSFLDSECSDQQGLSNVSTEVESRKYLKNLSRWDVISVGAFRQTLETAGNNQNASARWTSESDATSDGYSYGNMMKTNPLGTMLFNNNNNHNKASNALNQGRRQPGAISPVILPVRDGNRTPTNLPPNEIPQQAPNDQHTQHKTRKELRREKKKMKHKSTTGHVQHKNQHYHQHRHHHQHYPNMKSRSSSSTQRTNFFSSPTSSVPALNL